MNNIIKPKKVRARDWMVGDIIKCFNINEYYIILKRKGSLDYPKFKILHLQDGRIFWIDYPFIVSDRQTKLYCGDKREVYRVKGDEVK